MSQPEPMISTPIPRGGKPRRKRRFSLTPTQRDVLDAVYQGFSEQHIGEWLGMRVATVQTHILRIARKLPPHGDLKGYKKLLAWVCMNKQEAA